MNTIKARETLGLSVTFNDKDLEAAYRDMARKYHPNGFLNAPKDVQDKAAEKFKEVREAHEYLQNNSITFIKKKINFAFEFYTVNDIVEGDYANIFGSHRFIINKMISQYRERVYEVKDIPTANSIFKEFKEEIIKKYDDFKAAIFDCWQMDSSKKYIFLNYECSLKEFLRQLIEIRNKEIEKQNLTIRDSIQQYTLWPGYDFLKKKIEIVLEKSLESTRKINVDRAQIEKAMHNEIRRLFDFHSGMLRRFKVFKDYFDSIYGVDAFSRVRLGELRVSEEEYAWIFSLDKCWKDYNNGLAFYECDSRLRKVEKDFVSIKRRLDAIKNKAVMQMIFEIVTKNFYEAMIKYNGNTDSRIMVMASNIYQRFVGLYSNVMDSRVVVSNIDILKNLSFSDLVGAQSLLDSLDVKENKWRDIKLYIDKQEKFLCAVKDESENRVSLVGYVNGQVRQMEFERAMFKANFISLDDFLDKAEFLGEKNTGFGYDALFKEKGLILIRDEKLEEKYQIMGFSDYFTFGEVMSDRKYADKRLVKKEIMEAYADLFSREMVRI